MCRSLFYVFLFLLIHEVNSQNIFFPSSISIGDVVNSVKAVSRLLTSNSTDILQAVLGQHSGEPGARLDKLLSFRSRYDIGTECLEHTFAFMQSLVLGENWALRMVDAIGKPPSGLLEGKLVWLGDWEECRAVKAVAYENATAKSSPRQLFTGKYCTVKYSVQGIPAQAMFLGAEPSFSIGVCLPGSCDSKDGENLVKLLTSILPFNASLPHPTAVTCNDDTVPLNARAIIVIVVCAVFLFIITVATLYDVLYVHWLSKQAPPSSKQHCPLQGHQNGGFTAESSLSTQTDSASTPKSIHSEMAVLETTAAAPVSDKQPDITLHDPESHKLPKDKPDPVAQVLLAFSAFTNGTKLLSTHQPRGSLTAVHGIRFLSMSWVIVGHSFIFIGSSADNLPQFLQDLMKRFSFMPILNGTLSVDSFFLLSGLLLSYLTLKELKKRKGAKHINWGLFYFHRFWRLTPPYMLFLMMYVSLNMYWGNGPLWKSQGQEANDCDTWFTNLLYVNNLVETRKQCFGWAWYLANDMQFFVLSPLMLVPLYHLPVLGVLMCLAFLLVSTVSSGLISMHYKLAPSFYLDMSTVDHYMFDYYMKPWCRVGPYAVGVFAGYLLYGSDDRIRLSKITNVIGWLVAVSVGALVVYGLYSEDLTNLLSLEMSAVYNATSRSLWGACVAWVIYACATGNGGPVNHVLSWPGFVPLSRLSYGAYLVHPVLMEIYLRSVRTLIHAYDYSLIYITLGHLCVSYAGAFVVSLAFEAPMMGLEKVLLRRAKSS